MLLKQRIMLKDTSPLRKILKVTAVKSRLILSYSHTLRDSQTDALVDTGRASEKPSPPYILRLWRKVSLGEARKSTGRGNCHSGSIHRGVCYLTDAGLSNVSRSTRVSAAQKYSARGPYVRVRSAPLVLLTGRIDAFESHCGCWKESPIVPDLI